MKTTSSFRAFLPGLACVLLTSPDAPAREVKLPVPIEDVHAPVFIYPSPSNGGILFTEPDGKTVRYLYRPYPKEGKVDKVHEHEGGGPVVYQDISTYGGQTWRLREKVFESDFHSNGDVAYMHPDTHELFWTYKIRKTDTFLIRSAEGRTVWGEKIRLPFSLRYDNGSFTWLEKKEGDGGVRRRVLATHDGKGVVTWTSDNDGTTWQGPSNRCVAPVAGKGRWPDPGNSGHIVELGDGRLWMQTRNCQDHLWEYISTDRGRSWSKGRPSRFVGVFSCFRLYRIPDGRLAVEFPGPGELDAGNEHRTLDLIRCLLGTPLPDRARRPARPVGRQREPILGGNV